MTVRRVRPAAALGKLASPRLGRVFDRERLFTILDDLSALPAIWLAAPPGSGKTTLAATWLRRREFIALWLQLDAGDGDPATFVQSLDALYRGAGAQPVDLPPFGSDDLSDLVGSLRRRFRYMLPVLPPRWTLVLDNYQELPATSVLQHALAESLADLPVGVQWVFASRAPPPPAYTKALARQQLAVLTAEQLRFDDAETRGLIRLHGRPETMATPLAAAQGWAAGMTLMLLGTPRGAALPALDARDRLFDYFADEVLSRMPQEQQRALCELAYLPSTTTELAVAMSGYSGAGELLGRLAAVSLFTDRREGPPAVFVFHALFSEFLRRRLERTASPEEQRALQLRAARLLAEAGESDAALQRMIEADAWEEAQAWIRRWAPGYVADGRMLALRQHIESLPAQASAPLAYWRGFCAVDVDPAAALADMTSAYEASVSSGDIEGQLEAAAGAASALVSTGRVTELDRWIEVLSANAGSGVLGRDANTDMRLVPGLLAALVYRMPWHPLASTLGDLAERLLHHESAAGQRLLLGSLAFHLLWRGHVDRLQRIVLRIDALCAQRLAAPATMMRWWGVGILVKTLLGNHASAREDAQQALALVESEASLATQRAAAELQAMMVALACVDAGSARRHLDRAAQALHPDNYIDRTTYEHQCGMLAMLVNDRPAALRLMREAVRSALTSGFPMREHIALIANALAAAHIDEHAEAQSLLEQVFSHPFFPMCRWHHWVANIVAAYAALRRADGNEAARRLRSALRIARECGFRYGPMLFSCGDMMARLSALALKLGIEPDIARDIVLRHQLRAPQEAGESWPWAVRVFLLGRFEVQIDGAPMPSSRKESRRLLDLLRVLASYATAPLAQERVADELWPDSEGDAARNALDNSLHRLRKALGGDDRILLRHGALALNAQRCWTDVGALERLLAQVEEADAPELPSLLRGVLALYRGPLLPDESLPLIQAKRAVLHRRVERVLQAAGRRLGEAGMAAPAAIESLPDL